MKYGVFYFNQYQGNEAPDALYIRGLGIGESVLRGMVNFGDIDQYVLMYFHTPATATIGNREPTDVGKSLIFWDRHTLSMYGDRQNPWVHSWLVFGGETATRIMKQYGIKLNEPFKLEIGSTVDSYLNAMHHELLSGFGQDEHMLELMVHAFLYDLQRHLQQQHGPAPERIKAAADYISNHLNNPILLEEVARQSNLSIPRFSTLFKQYYGESPIRFANRRRMSLAAALLRSRLYNIKEIAFQCGFSNSLYFSTRFHSYWGMSPSEFQKQN